MCKVNDVLHSPYMMMHPDPPPPHTHTHSFQERKMLTVDDDYEEPLLTVVEVGGEENAVSVDAHMYI